MLDRYHIEHELGTGARGTVFRGCDRETGRAVAIKLIPDGVASVAVARGSNGQLRAAAEERAQLAHPQLAAVLETGRAGHLRYVVMEFAEGADLRAHTSPSSLLPLSTVLSAIVRVAGAVHYLHECGMTHGDIKPANIVFDARSTGVRLIDLPAGAEDEIDLRAGTLAYMSPERLCGRGASAAADQFSLAVTLYQLACGHLPFAGSSRPALARRIVNEPHRDIRVHKRLLSDELAAVFDRALAKEACGRYRDVRALKQALTRLEPQLVCRRDVPEITPNIAHGLCTP